MINQVNTDSKIISIKDDGQHEVTLISIKEICSKPSMQYAGVTPQLVFEFKGIIAKGTIKLIVNLESYKVADDYTTEEQKEKTFIIDSNGRKYEIDTETNERVVCEQRTDNCLNYVGILANHLGHERGTEIELHQLLGRNIVLDIKNEKIINTIKP